MHLLIILGFFLSRCSNSFLKALAFSHGFSCAALYYHTFLIQDSLSLMLLGISFPLPSLDSVVFVFEPNSLSSFLSSLWTSSREMEKKFLTLSSLVLHVHYFRIRVVLHSCKLAQAVIVWRGFIGSLVGHRSWEFWILVWALLDRISYSFIIWPNLCTFSQEYWKVHMIQRPFPVKYKNWI